MPHTTLRLPRFLGRLLLGALAHVGRFGLMVAELFRGLREWRIWFPRGMAESASIGIGSLPIVLLIAGFAGAVTAFQAGYQWQTSLPVYVLGTLITETIILELGPVLIGLVLAGGSARVTPPSSARCGSPSRSTRWSRWAARRPRTSSSRGCSPRR